MIKSKSKSIKLLIDNGFTFTAKQYYEASNRSFVEINELCIYFYFSFLTNLLPRRLADLRLVCISSPNVQIFDYDITPLWTVP